MPSSYLRQARLALLACAFAAPTSAQLFLRVTRYDDAAPTTGGNVGDLRNSLLLANANPGSHVQILVSGAAVITLQAPLPFLTTSMTIDKVGGPATVSGNNLYRIFFVDAPGATVTIRDLTLAN